MLTPSPESLEIAQKTVRQAQQKGVGSRQIGRSAALIHEIALALDRRAERARREDEFRALGWAVAIHNDYRLNGEPHTFWLFTKGDRCVKGEGRTDAEALAQVAAILSSPAPGGETL